MTSCRYWMPVVEVLVAVTAALDAVAHDAWLATLVLWLVCFRRAAL